MTKCKSIFVLPLVTLTGLVGARPAAHATCTVDNGVIEVAPTGDCTSIQDAADAATSGTSSNPITVNIAAGTYAERVSVTNDYINFVGAGPDNTDVGLDTP